MTVLIKSQISVGVEMLSRLVLVKGKKCPKTLDDYAQKTFH